MRLVDYLLPCWLEFLWLSVVVVGRPEGPVSSEDDATYYRDYLETLPGTWYEVVHPVQMRMSEVFPDLDTRDHKAAKQKTTHYHTTNIEMNMLSKKHKIKLELNRDLLPAGFKLKHDLDEKVQVIEETWLDNCFYQGQVRRVDESLVIVSTCNGIRGVIIMAHQMYLIQPLPLLQNATESQPRYPHVLYRSVPSSATTCANDRGMWVSYKSLHHGEFLSNIKIMKSMEEGEKVLQEMKSLRIAVAIDSTLFSQINGSLVDAVHYVALVTNIADAMLKDARITVKLVYTEVWNRRDAIHVSTNARETLSSFLQYRQDAMTRVHIDFAHLLTGRSFDNEELGMAVADSICSNRSTAVSQVASVHDLWQAAYGVVHMLGHVLGVSHDTEQCSCSDVHNGCIMTQTSRRSTLSLHARGWSACSIKDINDSMLSRLSGCLLANSAPAEVKYVQRCGNGVLEHGEECDCVNDKECELKDPCCDSKTCLLKPWATCRRGDCCHNCTVRPHYQMCRDAFGECDVPEFCDGVSGHCPVNTLTQDGQLCGEGQGYCYRGVCQTYSDQCQSLWGTLSSAADDKCYETFNSAGRFNGHCGVNATSGEYIKCAVENVKCGLLHCTGGVEKPLIAQNQTFSKTVVYSDGKEYECKIVNGAPAELMTSSIHADVLHPGMVKDGSQCSDGGVCIGSACVSLSHVMLVPCVTGSNGLVCSGHGICTTDVRCYCYAGYTGVDCSERTNITVIPLSTTTPLTPSPDPSLVTVADDSLLVNYSVTTDPNITVAVPEKSIVQAGASRSATTWWLMFVLAAVIVVAIIVLAFCLLCYRRRSPLNTKKPKKMVKHSTFGSVTSFSSHKSHDSYDPVTNRIISFGKMPSYKEEKLKRAMKQYQQQQRSSAASETASDRSRTDRDSTEIKAVTLPLAAPPERGILKKCSSRGSKAARAATLPSPRISAALDAGSTTVPDNTTTLLPVENAPQPVGETSADKLEFIDDDDDDDCCSCSCEEDEEELVNAPPMLASAVAGNVAVVLPKKPASDCSGCSRETQTDPESLASSVNSVYDTESKISRLSNINELLRQIDEQFNSVLRATSLSLPDDVDLSPTNSDDLRASDPEADRGCAGFYRQRDAAKTDGRPAASGAVSPAKSVPLGAVGGPVDAGGPQRAFRPVMKPLAVPSLASFSGSHSEPDTALKRSRHRAPTSSPFAPNRSTHAPPLDDRGVPLHRPIAVSLPLVSSSPATVASEGYHSDRVSGSAEPELPVIIREIPTNVAGTSLLGAPGTESNPRQLRLSTNLLNSPEDVDV